MEAIVIFFIFYLIYCKINNSQKTKKPKIKTFNKYEDIFYKKGFSNVVKRKITTIYDEYTADRKGDNYLITFPKVVPSQDYINKMAEDMKQYHYHKGIVLIHGYVSESVKEYAKINEIKIINPNDLPKERKFEDYSNNVDEDAIKVTEKNYEGIKDRDNLFEDSAIKNKYNLTNDEEPIQSYISKNSPKYVLIFIIIMFVIGMIIPFIINMI